MKNVYHLLLLRKEEPVAMLLNVQHEEVMKSAEILRRELKLKGLNHPPVCQQGVRIL